MGHFPAGTSSKLAAHFAQFILKGNNIHEYCAYRARQGNKGTNMKQIIFTRLKFSKSCCSYAV